MPLTLISGIAMVEPAVCHGSLAGSGSGVGDARMVAGRRGRSAARRVVGSFVLGGLLWVL